MKQANLPFGNRNFEIAFSDDVDVLRMGTPVPLDNPEQRIQDALDDSIGSPGLDEIIARKVQTKAGSSAVVVISDSTRPVPYSGEQGILWPVVERLISGGIDPERITILVATGTHRALRDDEIRSMIDPRVPAAGVRVMNHDCKDENGLLFLGKTARGSEIFINRLYMESDIRILTGLIESHFMAGVSGGRKSICPGIVGEESTYIFHGASMMAHPNTTDLLLDGNPCHEESLEVAETAGADYIVNVTLDHEFNITGVFAGDLKAAHAAGVAHLKGYIQVPHRGDYDVVVTHGGFVGINHYQTAKAATIAARIVRPGGHVLMVSNNSDADPVGSLAYRTVLQLLTLTGPEAVSALLQSPDWTFIPEQWQVQMWIRLFDTIPPDHFFYYSPQFGDAEYALIPGKKLSTLAGFSGSNPPATEIPTLIDDALEALRSADTGGKQLRVAYLQDGPYGIPLRDS
jgi:lactate racemase